jgi:hypothetical protein
MFSLPLDATQRKPQHGDEVPEQGKKFATFSQSVFVSSYETAMSIGLQELRLLALKRFRAYG